jgi:hypothetical protein
MRRSQRNQGQISSEEKKKTPKKRGLTDKNRGADPALALKRKCLGIIRKTPNITPDKRLPTGQSAGEFAWAYVKAKYIKRRRYVKTKTTLIPNNAQPAAPPSKPTGQKVEGRSTWLKPKAK